MTTATLPQNISLMNSIRYTAKIYFRNKLYSKSFSIKKYGSDKALQLAIGAAAVFRKQICDTLSKVDKRPIRGFSNYNITSTGDVIGQTGLPMKLNVKNGYFTIDLYNGKGKRKTHYVHRLVAAAWLDPPDDVNKIFVNHKNLNKKDNDHTNLEWVTPGEKNLHAHENSTRNVFKAAIPKSLEGFVDMLDYPNQFMINTLGEIYNKKKNRLVASYKTDDGYMRVQLAADKCFVHVLVAKQFLPPVEGLLFINHINGIKVDNNVQNLERTDRQKNGQHAADVLGAWKKKVQQIDKKTNQIITEYESVKVASEVTKVNNTNISRCCNGGAKTAGGFIWKHCNTSIDTIG